MRSLQMVSAALLVVLAPVIHCRAAGTGAEFLRLDTGARAMALGSAYTAVADGINSLHYNPAGLSSAKGVEIGFTHANWLLGSSHDFIGLATPLKGGLAAGLGVTRLGNSSLETRGADRSVGGGFSAYDQAVTLGLAGKAGRYRGGAAVKYIESAIAGERAAGVAVDLGLSRTLGGRLPVSIGLAVQNLGTPIRYMTQKDRLPLAFSAGLLLPVIQGFNLALDVKRLVYDKQTAVSVGSEYVFMPGFALRSGYMTGGDPENIKNGGVSLGAGINLLNMQLDYSAAPFGELGNTQKFTLTRRF